MANEFENLRLGTEEFAKAMKESFEKWSEEFNKIGERMKDDFPFMAYDDMYPEYGGRIRLDYCNGNGAWQDVVNILIANGYAVTVYTDDATLVERDTYHIDKFVFIEFSERE